MRLGGIAAVLLASAVGAVGLYFSWNAVSSVLRPTPVAEGERKPVGLAEPSPARPASESDSSQPVQVALHGNLVAEAPLAPAPAAVRQAAVDTAPPTEKDEAAAPLDSEEDGDVTPTLEGRPKARPGRRGLVILQIGDSHTAADFLTGELRRRLQARYGRGAPGYVTAGKPHIGVRSSSLKITASSGWSYKSLQRPDAAAPEFWLSGYNAVASAVGEVMTFGTERPQAFETIEIEVLRQPGGGTIDVKLDGVIETTYNLASPKVEPVVIRLVPSRGATERMRELSIKITGAGQVSVASVAIHNKQSGVTYNSIGYPGAQASLLNKFTSRLFANDLMRINPQIVVLAFGTNEAFNEKLDLPAYAKTYERIVDKIRSALPRAVIVVVGPPDFAELPAACRKDKAPQATCRTSPREVTATNGTSNGNADASECLWRTPARLARIRQVQREIADRQGLVYWNWASIMPSECGAHRWATASPPLMAKDHVHFTIEGYKKSADHFLQTLIPVIEKVRVGANAVSHN
jgi:lysophospholipase L1-like esterase